MLSTAEYNKQLEELPKKEAEEFSDAELLEGAALLVDALTLPPPPMVIVKGQDVMVRHLEPQPNDGLTPEEFMSIYHDGEMAATNCRPMLESPYLDDPKRLSIWMLGYMEQPIESARPLPS